MRTFKLSRSKDVSGVSGTGDVAEGVEFENGQVALHWLSQYDSIAIFQNIHTVEVIHGHEGATQVVFEEECGVP